MSGFAKVCFCGARALPGSSRCIRHPLSPVDEAARLARQPYRQGYTDPEYLRNRPIVYAEAGGHCEACGGPLGPDWECDHIVPLRDGGTSVRSNLQALCGPCSKAKTRADRRRRRERRQS